MLPRSFRIEVVPGEPGRRLTGPMMLAGLVLLAAAVVRFSGLDGAGVSFCYFKALTGHACLTCGATRAIGHLARFDLSQAFLIQPLLTAATVGVLVWGLLDAALLPAARRTVVRLEGRAPRMVLFGLAALSGLNWAYLLATGV